MPAFDRPPLDVYATLRAIPARLGPCYIWRAARRLLVAITPGTPRVVVMDFVVMNMSTEEQNAFRWHVGCGPVGTPLPEWLCDGVIDSVFPELRLPSEALAYGISADWPRMGMVG